MEERRRTEGLKAFSRIESLRELTKEDLRED